MIAAACGVVMGCGSPSGVPSQDHDALCDVGAAGDDAGDDAPVVCDLGAHGGPVSCDPTDPWWFVATSDGTTDTLASCAASACPLKSACFVGATEGYCR